MAAITALADAVAEEASAFADLLATLDAARRRALTPCAGWTVDDLAAHVATGALRDAEDFHRVRRRDRPVMLRRLDVGDRRIDVLDPYRLAPLFSSAIRPL